MSIMLLFIGHMHRLNEEKDYEKMSMRKLLHANCMYIKCDKYKTLCHAKARHECTKNIRKFEPPHKLLLIDI